MAHGGEKGALDAAGLLRLLLGDLQLLMQAFALGHVDPAAYQPQDLSLDVSIGSDPEMALPGLPMHLHDPVEGLRLTPLQHLQELALQGFGVAGIQPAVIGHAGSLGGLAGEPGEFEVAAIAGQQAPFPVAHGDRKGNAVDQGALELQAEVQLLLGPAALPHFDLQSPVPQDEHRQRQHDAQQQPVELCPIPFPYAVGWFRCSGPAADDLRQIIGRNREQGLVQDAQQFRLGAGYRKGKIPGTAIQRGDDA
ncbi:hypothetical protein D3C78_1163960 [compost metagenome]